MTKIPKSSGGDARAFAGETMAAERVTGHATLEACALKVCVNKKADEGDATGNFEPADEKTSTEFSPLEDTASFAGGEGVGTETERKMFMSPEDIDVILSHKARGDSFKQFQARIRKEVAETGHFEISEQYVENVLAYQAMYRGEWSNLRSQYPNLVWEEDDDDGADEAAKFG